LSDFPELGRSTGDPGTFEIVVPRYLYIVAYRIEADRRTVSILGVFHAAQGSRET
jgi:plasmid stabilization system protein ParE